MRGDLTVEAARQYLARFRFWGDDPLRVVAGFSGGERSRLALAKLLLEPRNLLFLDEPTNHLDIPAAEILEEALSSFEGTVILVSHDRRFLETVTTRIVAVRDGHADVYPGGFTDFQGHVRAAAAKKEPVKKEPAKKEPAKKEKPAQRTDHERQKEASREQERRRRRAKELEALIASGEAQLGELRAKLKSAPGEDWEKLASWAAEEQALKKRVDAFLLEWATVSD